MKQSALQLERATRVKINDLPFKYSDCTDIYCSIRKIICVCYLDARIYGTDEKDVGEDDEDTNVDSQHDRGAAKKNTDINSEVNSFASCLLCLVYLGWFKGSQSTSFENQTSGLRTADKEVCGYLCKITNY